MGTVWSFVRTELDQNRRRQIDLLHCIPTATLEIVENLCNKEVNLSCDRKEQIRMPLNVVYKPRCTRFQNLPGTEYDWKLEICDDYDY